MVEVFKTNVKSRRQAKLLIKQIHAKFPEYQANFDLDDCDKILRVKSSNGYIESDYLIGLLSNYGYHADILTDDLPVGNGLSANKL